MQINIFSLPFQYRKEGENHNLHLFFHAGTVSLNLEKESAGIYRYGDGTYWNQYSLSRETTANSNNGPTRDIFILWQNVGIDDDGRALSHFTYFAICQANPTNFVQQ